MCADHRGLCSVTLMPSPRACELDSDLGRALIEAAHELDPLTARAPLRRRYPDASDELIRAATLQAELAQRAEPRFGPIAHEVLWSSDGLEQASRPGVARYRARRLAAAGVDATADLTCGLGLDALAMAAEGITVLAVEQDPATASLAAANARRLGGGRIEVIHGACTAADVQASAAEADAWFVDPSRRSERRGRDGRHLRLDDPESWSPPWSWVVAQAGTPRILMVKAAPGLPHEAIVDVPGCRVDAEWVSQGGQLLETCVTWTRPTGDPAAHLSRAAVMLDAGGEVILRVTVAPSRPHTNHPTAGVPAVGEFLLDPDPAIVRSGTVLDFARLAAARMIDPHLAYLVVSHPLPPALQPAARTWQVLDSGDYDPRRIRAVCAAHDIGGVEVTGRGRRLDPARVRRDLKLRGRGKRGVLVVMGLGPSRVTQVCLCVSPLQ